MQPIEIKSTRFIRFLIWSGIWNPATSGDICGLRAAYFRTFMLVLFGTLVFNGVGPFTLWMTADPDLTSHITGGAPSFSLMWFWNTFLFNCMMWWILIKAVTVAFALAAGIVVVLFAIGFVIRCLYLNIKEQLKKRSEVVNKPSNISVMYKSWKEKVCVPVIVVKK